MGSIGPSSDREKHGKDITNGVDSSSPDMDEIQQKYEHERQKRLRSDGQSQFVEVLHSEKYKHFADDIWLPEDGSVSGIQVKDDLRSKFIILGAGYGGLLSAIQLVQAGFKPSDIVMIDSAGGFGGTWYWNRYPGLMCDVESYCYLPLLEETGYMPKHRYSYGTEIREYANMIAKKWNIDDRAVFRSMFKSLVWDDTSQEWVLEIVQQQGQDGKEIHAKVAGSYVITVSGLLNYPKLPVLPGIEDYQGSSFHTSRWDYRLTGGSPENPELTALKGKRVGIVGTGATCIQALPHLAQYAKEVLVFQRTPSSVDERGQRPTDPSKWKSSIANQTGWQTKRRRNFAACLSNDPATGAKNIPNMVDDGWTNLTSYCALVGGPREVNPTPDSIAAHVRWLHTIDAPRSERVRRRVDEVVEDKETAASLKAWYPGWCKRPCFHDEYLQTYNHSHVNLIDTDGKGIDRLTKTGVVAAGTEYPVDILIWSTGFASPGKGGPDSRADITVTGRSGISMSQKYEQNGVGTLHGVISRDFPNLFFPGPSQCGVTANQMFVLETTSQHVAYIISQAEQQRTIPDQKVVIEPSFEAEEEWSMLCAAQAAALAGMSGCTPSYLNLEGETEKINQLPQEEKLKKARGSIWGKGLNNYLDVIEAWRDGQLRGLEITVT